MEYENGNYQQQMPSGSLADFAKGLPHNQTEDPLAKLLREYRDAKYRFDNACQSAAKAIQERDQATGALEKISQAVEKAVASGRYDPTQPQAATTPIIPPYVSSINKQF